MFLEVPAVSRIIEENESLLANQTNLRVWGRGWLYVITAYCGIY